MVSEQQHIYQDTKEFIKAGTDHMVGDIAEVSS